MNKNINFCKILKGHEEEIFYNPLLGNIELARIEDKYIVFIYNGGLDELFIKHDGSSVSTDELAIFPSKDQRDWFKWIEEQNKKTPKTWSELSKDDSLQLECSAEIGRTWKNAIYDNTKNSSPIEKSALALLKIHQLIEVSYGGNVTNEEWNNCRILKYVITYRGDKFCEDEYELQKEVVAFHTSEQRKEFLKYPENVQLLKDYFIIN